MYVSQLSVTPIAGDAIPTGNNAIFSSVPVYRDLALTLNLPWQSATNLRAKVETPWQTSPAFSLPISLDWQIKPTLVNPVKLPFDSLAALVATVSSHWAGGQVFAFINPLHFQFLTPRITTTRSGWDQTNAQSKPIQAPWLILQSITRPASILYAQSPVIARANRIPWGPSQHKARAVVIPWGIARLPRWQIDPDGDGGGDGGADIYGTWRIIARRSYSMLHDISLVRLPDRLPIAASRLGFAKTADSPHLSFTATLEGQAALDAVKPVDESPVILEASVDGQVVQVVLDPPRKTARFAQPSRTITGRGLTWLLGKPYLMPTNRTSSDDASIQQLALAELPFGWSLSWSPDLPDHTVPEGAWSARQMTPIQAIERLAKSVGGIVDPALAAQSMSIKPRYAVMPWDYDLATPAMVIPEVAIIELEEEYAPALYANAVYCYGGPVGGVMGRVYREGTAGDRQLPPVQDDLLTHTDAAYSRGKRELAAHWKQPEIRSLIIPFNNGEFPLVALGSLVKVEGISRNIYGCVSAVSWSAQLAKVGGGRVQCRVTQKIVLGEDSGDVLARYEKLNPGDPLLVGEVVAVFSDGTVAVDLPDGSSARVRGVAGVGDSVYVQAGRIMDQAPHFEAVGLVC